MRLFFKKTAKIRARMIQNTAIKLRLVPSRTVLLNMMSVSTFISGTLTAVIRAANLTKPVVKISSNLIRGIKCPSQEFLSRGLITPGILAFASKAVARMASTFLPVLTEQLETHVRDCITTYPYLAVCKHVLHNILDTCPVE